MSAYTQVLRCIERWVEEKKRDRRGSERKDRIGLEVQAATIILYMVMSHV